MKTKKGPCRAAPDTTNNFNNSSTIPARVKSWCIDHLAAWMYEGKIDAAVLLAVAIWIAFGWRLARW